MPPEHHCELFLSALKHKKHILCEKPLALSNEDAAEMARASLLAEAQGIISAINFPMAFIPALKELKFRLNEAYLGELRRIDLVLRFPRWPRPFLNFEKESWIAKRGIGGPLREICTHFFFVLMHLFEDLELFLNIIAKISYEKDDDSASEVSATALMLLKNRAHLQLDLLANYAGAHEQIELIFHGSLRSISLENFQFLKLHEEQRLSPELGKKADNSVFMDSAPVVEEMRKAICGQAHRLVPIAMGEASQRVLNAIFSSEGQWLKP